MGGFEERVPGGGVFGCVFSLLFSFLLSPF